MLRVRGQPCSDRQAAGNRQQRPEQRGVRALRPWHVRRAVGDFGQVVAADLRRICRDVGAVGPTLALVLAFGKPFPLLPVGVPGSAEHVVLGTWRIRRRGALFAIRPPELLFRTGRAGQYPAHRPGGESLGTDLLRERRRVCGLPVRLQREPRRVLVVAVVARRGRGIHGDHDLWPRLPHYADQLCEHVVVVPGLFGQRRADRVVGVRLVQVVHVGDAECAYRAAFLALAQQAQPRPFLRAGGVPTAFPTGDGHDAGADLVCVLPLPERRQQRSLVVGMRPDEENAEVPIGNRLRGNHGHKHSGAQRRRQHNNRTSTNRWHRHSRGETITHPREWHPSDFNGNRHADFH